jgi:phage gp36-like protein|tara:strand:- start:3131 stop:3568 length:438 start_codon:yes stop_codon:yes gene_type:complete
MAYTDLTAINQNLPAKTLIQLTDDNATGQIDTNVVDWAIEQAEETIDAYHRGRYPVDIPDGEVPGFVKVVATDIAIYRLFKRKMITALPDSVQKCYDSALKWLKDSQEGEVSPFPESESNQRVTVRTRDRVFTSTKLAQYRCSGC